VKIKLFKLPNVVKSVYGKRIWQSKNNKAVYCTFDDGPHKEITPWLLQLAKEENIKLNFFWLGRNLNQVANAIESAKKEGHFVGNHGFDHLKYTKVSKHEYLDNFFKGKDLFPDNAFRPPYGRVSPSLAKEIQVHSPIIMWTWLSYDWERSVSNETILQKLKEDVHGGEILVFHESEKTKNRIFELVPKVISILKKKGLTLHTLDEVIKENEQYE